MNEQEPQRSAIFQKILIPAMIFLASCGPAVEAQPPQPIDCAASHIPQTVLLVDPETVEVQEGDEKMFTVELENLDRWFNSRYGAECEFYFSPGDGAGILNVHSSRNNTSLQQTSR